MKRSIVVVLALAFFAAAASPAPAQWAGSPEIKALYEAAKAEGEVIIWGPQQRAVSWIPRAFAQMFPDVAVKPHAASDIANRAMLDARSSQFGVDALWLEFPAAAPVMRRDLVAAIDWQQFGVGAGNLAFDGRMAFTNNIIYVVAYNSEQVKDSDVPGSWQDLLDDKYQGRMVASLYQLPQLIAGLAQEWGSDRSLQFARDLLVGSRILMTRAPRDAYLKSGDRPFSVGEIDTLPRLWAADGLAIGYKVLEPVLAHQFGVMVMSNAPHPNAARLLAGWLASREGKRARERATGEIDYRPGSDNEIARRLQTTGIKFIYENADRSADRETLLNRLTAILSSTPR